MRILELLPRIPHPPNDGGAIAMLHMLEGLSARGHQLTQAALNTIKHKADPDVLRQYGQCYSVEIDTTPTTRSAMGALLFSRTPYHYLRFLSEDFSKLLMRILSQQQFDIIQLEGMYMANYLDVLRRHSRARIVLRAHNAEYEIWRRVAENELNPLKRAYYSHMADSGMQYERSQLQRFDGVVAISQQDADKFRELGYRGPMISIPTGVQVPERLPQLPEQPNHLAYLGALDWHPNVQGVQWFLEAVWPLLQGKRPNLHLDIAGKNPTDEVLQWRYKDVSMLGMVPDATQFLLQYPVVIAPIIAGSGIKIKLLQALALGRAVVTTSMGAEGLALRNGRELIIADTPEEQAAQILKLLDNPLLRQRMGQAGRKQVAEQYAPAPLIKQLEDFYSLLML